MTRIAATEERTFVLAAPVESVYAFFADPDRVREEFEDVVVHQPIGPGRVHWRLREKVEKGIRFGPDYVVQFEGNGADQVRWFSVGGNMGNDGEVHLSPCEGGTEVRYRETIAPDLPLSALMARVFGRVVERELRADLGRFLERVERRFRAS